MMNRYSLCVLSNYRYAGIEDNIKVSVLKRLEKSFKYFNKNLGEYAFGWGEDNEARVLRSLDQKEKKELPKDTNKFSIPSRVAITVSLSEINASSDDDEFLFYYFGHAYSVGDGECMLGLENAEDNRAHRFISILDDIRDRKFKKIYFVIDACHVSRDITVQKYFSQCYGIYSSKDGNYSYIAKSGMTFSEILFDRLSRQIDGIQDDIVDKPKGAITFKTWFNSAKISVNNSDEYNVEPSDYGGLGDQVLMPYPLKIKKEKNERAPSRTIYNRVYKILEFINAGSDSFNKLKRKVFEDKDNVFLISQIGGLTNYISDERLREYLLFMGKIKFVELFDIGSKGNIRIQLKENGKYASNNREYNVYLINGIKDNILPDEVDIEVLQGIVHDLIENHIVPNARSVFNHFKKMEYQTCSYKYLKMAFLIIPFTKAFNKASEDTILPSGYD